MKNHAGIDWLIRFVKGIFIGTGFILPGVSGGALAAIFGLYERMISFLAHLTTDFKEHMRFFLPVGFGMLAGIILLSYPLGYFLDHAFGPTMWFFIGAILGTFPSLWREAGKKGRAAGHLAVMLVTAAAGFIGLKYGAAAFDGQLAQNMGTWFLAGAIIALGVLIPGLSPSNFLLYMGMYGAMVEAFKRLDLAVLIPIAAGGLVCMLIFSKLVDWMFAKAYAGLFHVILGVVIASTLMIVPLDFNYSVGGLIVCMITCTGGIVLGDWMSRLEEQYLPESEDMK